MWGGLGAEKRRFLMHGLSDLAEELEKRHGYIPWLHPVDNYGSEDPELEAVVAHPVALDRRAG
jgi:hypothetical protein